MTNFLQHTRLHHSSTLKFGGRGIGVERPPSVRRGRGRGRRGYGGGGADGLEVVAGHHHLLRGTGAAARVEVVAHHRVVLLRVGAHQIEQLAAAVAATGGRRRCRARRREPEDLLVHELRRVHRDRDLAGAGWLVAEGGEGEG